MLRLLIKKQLTEVFRSYFYDAKKNRMRSKWAVVAWFAFFVVIMAGFLGGVFTALSLSLCAPLASVGMGWLFYALMGGIAIFLGAFGSVFNSYAGLYLAKDNDLLLSLPIPVRHIIAARLANVWLLGAMYSAVALVPALIVGWVKLGAAPARVACGLLMLLTVTLIVLLLSCLLGWVVAKISLKLKHKSFATVAVSLLFIGGYYFFYFRANGLIRDIVLNAAVYGERIKGAARGVYLFGRMGEGDWGAAAAFTAAAVCLSAIVWTLMSRSFLSIATDTGRTAKARYVEKPARRKTPFAALLAKELGRFAASPNYILNCGLGILLIPAFGVLALVKGRQVQGALAVAFAGKPDCPAVLLCAALCLMASMIDVAAPSVSLEGRSLWIPQSLPVAPGTVLRAKACLQLVLSVPPMLFAGVCAAAVAEASPAVRFLIVLMPLAFTAFSAVGGLATGVRMPLLSWTSEVAPIKQSGAVTVALLGGWALGAVVGALYLWFGWRLGAAAYLAAWTVLFAAAAAALLRWLDTKGAERFAGLA